MNERPKPSTWGTPFVMVPTLTEFNRIGRSGKQSKHKDYSRRPHESPQSEKRKFIIPFKLTEKCQEVDPPQRKQADALAAIPLNYIRWSDKDVYPTERPSDERQNLEFLKKLLKGNEELNSAGFDYSILLDCLVQLDDACKAFDGNIELDYSVLIGQYIKKLGMDLNGKCSVRVSKYIYKFWRLRNSRLRLFVREGGISSRTIVQAFLPREKTESSLGRIRNTRTSTIGVLNKLHQYFSSAKEQRQWDAKESTSILASLGQEFKKYNQKLRNLGFKHTLDLSWMLSQEKKRSRSIVKKPRNKSVKQQKIYETPTLRGRNNKQVTENSSTALKRNKRKVGSSSSSTHSAEL